MAYRNHFTDKLQRKSSAELQKLLKSSGYVHDAKMAAKWILQDRNSLPEFIPDSLLEEDSNIISNGFTFFDKQSDCDKSQLKNNLIEFRKDSRIEFIFSGIVVLIAPYLAFRPDQTPLIEDMPYWEAVGYFSVFVGLISVGSYIIKGYAKASALQTDRKKIIVARILKVEDSINQKYHILTLQHKDLKVFNLPKFRVPPEKYDYVEMEFSERGNQLLNLTVITEDEYVKLGNKRDYESSERRTLFEVFTSIKPERLKLNDSVALFIPKGAHFITAIILIFNLFVFILMLVDGVDIYKPEIIDILHWGGNVNILTLEQGQYWRLLTSIFVHIGIAHILMNSLGFLFVAVLLERNLGRVSFAFVYLSTGILASLTSAIWNENVVSAGASGAIFGLYGFLLTQLVSTDRQQRKMNEGLIVSVIIFVLYNLTIGLTGNIDNAAHIGGLVSGIFVGLLLKTKDR